MEWKDPWVVTVGGGLVVAAVVAGASWLGRKRSANGSAVVEARSGDAAIVNPSGGTNVATGAVHGNVYVGPTHTPDELAAARIRAERDEEDGRDQAARDAELATTLFIATLEASLQACEERQPIGEPERGQIASARQEWDRVKPGLSILRAANLVEDTERWLDDVQYEYERMWDEQTPVRDVARVPGATDAAGFVGPILLEHRARIKRLLNEGKGTRNRYTALTKPHA
ncbi:MAG TPA: hypothetical protein VJY35_09950 [Candidatus Eisenbacteria bacterium]|nr:hypothetical protein [Candidatus Eisenbacteria bacterium]